jgi:hypothetical protein
MGAMRDSFQADAAAAYPRLRCISSVSMSCCAVRLRARAMAERLSKGPRPRETSAVAAIGFLHARFEAEQQQLGAASVRVLGLTEGAGLQQVRFGRSLRGRSVGRSAGSTSTSMVCSGRTS